MTEHKVNDEVLIEGTIVGKSMASGGGAYDVRVGHRLVIVNKNDIKTKGDIIEEHSVSENDE